MVKTRRQTIPPGPPDDDPRESKRLRALHDVSTILTSGVEPRVVVEAAVRGAAAILGADGASFLRWDPDADVLRPVSTWDPGHEVFVPVVPIGEGITGQTFLAREPTITNDYQSAPFAMPGALAIRTRAAVAVPVARGDNRLGVLLVRSRNPAVTFSEADARLLELFASQMAVAIESAELSEALEQRVERSRALDRHNRLISASLDLDEVLRVIARSAADLTGAVVASFWLADEAAETLDLRALSDDRFAEGTERSRRFGEGLVGATARSRALTIVDDTLADSRVAGQSWLRRNRLRTSCCVPVVSGESLLAVLVMHAREPFHLGPSEREILESFVAQAVVAIQNASLYSSVRRSQQVLQAIIEQSPSLVSLRDREGRYLLANRGWIEQIMPPGTRDIVGRTIEELFPPDRAARMREHHNRVLETCASVEYETLLGEGDHARAYLMVLAPLTDTDGTPYAVCTITRDITARKRAEAQMAAALASQRAANEQLERLNTAKSDFVAVVSHEFRTPLAGIKGLSELLRDESLSAAETRQFAADINRVAERLSRLVDDLLDLDRMESGETRLDLEAVDLGAVVADVVEELRPIAGQHHFRLETDPRLPALPGDRDKLAQVVVNLVSNAVKYAPDGGEVVIGTRLDGSEAHLWVADRGVGIPPEALETIFDRYARVESSEHRRAKGTGLGLPIVREIVTMHGGRVWATSVVGRGSEFHVALPLAGPPAASMSAARRGRRDAVVTGDDRGVG